MPAECGYNFPLMGILGAVNVSGSTADEAVEYENPSWPLNVTLEVVRDQAASPPIGGTFDLFQDNINIPGLSNFFFFSPSLMLTLTEFVLMLPCCCCCFVIGIAIVGFASNIVSNKHSDYYIHIVSPSKHLPNRSEIISLSYK